MIPSIPLPKSTSTAVAVLLATTSLCCGSEAFFKPGPKAPADLLANQIYPQGRELLYTFYSVGGGPTAKGAGAKIFPEEQLNAEMLRYKEAGLSVFGPQYELKERSLQDAEKYGMKTIYSVGLNVKFTKEQVVIEKEKVTEEITAQVKAVADNPNIVAWDLKPEELRPWRKEEIVYLEAAAAAIRAADPLNRPIYHYIPGHASAKRMVPIAKSVDLLGKGMYTNYSGIKDSRVWCRWSIEQEIAAIKEADSKAVPLSVPEMFQQPKEEELPLIPSWVRHDVYLSLVSGAKGVIIFSLRQRDGFTAWEPYYKAYLQVGKELLGPDKLGEVFLFGESRDDLQLKVVSGPAEVEMSFPVGGVKEPIKYPSVAHLNAAYEDARYLFLVNSANEPVQVEVNGVPNTAKSANLFEADAKLAVAGETIKVDLQPLEVKAFRFTRP